MNAFFHFFFNYLIASILFSIDSKYILLILFFSIIIDFDHLPYLLRNHRNILRKLSFGSVSRSRFHELYGVLIVSLLLSGAFFFFDLKLVSIVGLCLLLHFAIDFLFGHTRPFYPYSRKEVFTHLVPNNRLKLILEVVFTVVMGVFFIASI